MIRLPPPTDPTPEQVEAVRAWIVEELARQLVEHQKKLCKVD